VICAIAEVTDNVIEADKEPFECRVVTLAWFTLGIVGNGGFRYLFSADINGDPQYKLSVGAFDAIGAEAAHGAFRDALALFPNSIPPKDLEGRNRIFESIPKDSTDGIESRFYKAQPETERCLAAFIQQHRPAISEFLRTSGKGPIRQRTNGK
jgi:hypothetical protein